MSFFGFDTNLPKVESKNKKKQLEKDEPIANPSDVDAIMESKFAYALDTDQQIDHVIDGDDDALNDETFGNSSGPIGTSIFYLFS